MACPLYGAKPLSEPMLGGCQLYISEQMLVKSESKYNNSHTRKYV